MLSILFEVSSHATKYLFCFSIYSNLYIDNHITLGSILFFKLTVNTFTTGLKLTYSNYVRSVSDGSAQMTHKWRQWNVK